MAGSACTAHAARTAWRRGPSRRLMDADTSPFSRTGLFGGGAQDDVIPLRGWGGSPAAAHPPLLRRADDVYAVVAAEPPRHQARGGGLKTPGCSPAPPPGSSPAWSAEASKENWPTDLGSRRGRAGCSEGTRPQSRCRRRNPRLSPQPPPPKPRARAHREGRAPSSGPRTPAAAAPEALRQSQPPAGSVSAR